jgi:hypothetical protein
MNFNAEEFVPTNKMQSITHSSVSDSDSDTELICDELNKNLIIQKQIEDDLNTHDFTKPHVTREEIQEIIGMKIKNISYYQRSLVHKSI